jgi:vacuolar-type H+-ATPase subunit D/Vma8
MREYLRLEEPDPDPDPPGDPDFEEEVITRLDELETMSALLTGTVIPQLDKMMRYIKTIMSDQQINQQKTNKSLKEKR